jgi:hypothetical protein
VNQSEEKKEDETFCGSEFRNMELAPFMVCSIKYLK